MEKEHLTVTIHTPFIKLDALLKFAGSVRYGRIRQRIGAAGRCIRQRQRLHHAGQENLSQRCHHC